MVVAKVIGEVVSTVKVDKLVGQKMLLVETQKLTGEGKDRAFQPTGSTIVVNDPIGAGRGEIVLVVQGSSARMTDLTAHIPTDGLIIGIVDSINIDTNSVYRKDE